MTALPIAITVIGCVWLVTLGRECGRSGVSMWRVLGILLVNALLIAAVVWESR